MLRQVVFTVAACACCAAAIAEAPAIANTAAAASSLLFDGRFETSSYTPWNMPQCTNGANPANNASVHFGTYAIESTTVGQGRYGMRVDLPAWSGGLTRCEVWYARKETRGSDDYYSYMLYLPSGWSPGTSPSSWGDEVLQLDHPNLAGSAIDFHAQTGHITLAVQTGICSTTSTYCQYRSNADGGNANLPPLYAVPPGQLQLGVWHEFVIHVHWATDASGQIQVWHRLKGQTSWTKTASLSGYPTLQVDSKGALPSSTIDKEGIYRGASTRSTTVFLDGFTRSQSFATAAAALP